MSVIVIICVSFYMREVLMQQGRPTQLTDAVKEIRINQLKEQIRILEEQLDNAKRDLRLLEKEG